MFSFSSSEKQYDLLQELINVSRQIITMCVHTLANFPLKTDKANLQKAGTCWISTEVSLRM